MAERADVVVVGGGVIGVCTAHALVARGVDVRLVERGAIASGCSYGNAGWIFPSHSMPIPAPGVVRQSLRWLFDREGPLYIRPRPSVSLARWLWAFRAACSAERAREAYRLRRALSLASLGLYAELAEKPELDFSFARRGLLLLFKSEAARAEAAEELELLRALGGDGELLDAEQTRARAPAVAADVRSSLFLPAEAHVAPAEFVRALATDAQRRGLALQTDTEVLRAQRGDGSVRLQTTRGELVCDELVIATGAWSPILARDLGLRVPVQPAKGYSLTVRRPDDMDDLPLMLAEAKVGVSPIGATLRFAGTLELAGLNTGVNLQRVRAIERAVQAYLPGLPRIAELGDVEIWRGLRPLTPDDLPILGRPRGARGVVLATGHGMTGISQGPITGELAAELVCGETPRFDLTPFSPDRFR